MSPERSEGLICKKAWTVRIRPVHRNRGDDREGVIKAEREGQGRTVIRPKYDEEPALQSRYYIVIEGKFGGY